VLVSPARKPPNVALNAQGEAVVFNTRGEAALVGAGHDDNDEDDFSDAALAKPMPGCSDVQIKIGAWLQHKARCPHSLLAIFYTVKLRAWISLLV
jgi:hypothetical protein